MKKAAILILIAAFAFPAFGHAATSPAKASVQSPQVPVVDINSPVLEGKTLVTKKAIVQAALTDIYSQLAKLALQTQSAITQVGSNGISTTGAQADLVAATTSLTKAKADIATFSAITVSNTKYSSFTLDLMKSSAGTAEKSLGEAKTHLLDSLNTLKASLSIAE